MYPSECNEENHHYQLSKYNVDDVALGVCKTGAEEAGVTEVRTSLSEKKFELRSEERFSRNAETDLVCRLLLEKKNTKRTPIVSYKFIILLTVFHFAHP